MMMMMIAAQNAQDAMRVTIATAGYTVIVSCAVLSLSFVGVIFFPAGIFNVGQC
jgi:hypothetical protein